MESALESTNDFLFQHARHRTFPTVSREVAMRPVIKVARFTPKWYPIVASAKFATHPRIYVRGYRQRKRGGRWLAPSFHPTVGLQWPGIGCLAGSSCSLMQAAPSSLCEFLAHRHFSLSRTAGICEHAKNLGPGASPRSLYLPRLHPFKPARSSTRLPIPLL